MSSARKSESEEKKSLSPEEKRIKQLRLAVLELESHKEFLTSELSKEKAKNETANKTISELRQSKESQDKQASELKLGLSNKVSELNVQIETLDEELNIIRAENESLISKHKEETAKLNDEISKLSTTLSNRPTIVKYQDKIEYKVIEKPISSWISFKQDVSEHSRIIIALCIISSCIVLATFAIYHYSSEFLAFTNSIARFFSWLFHSR